MFRRIKVFFLFFFFVMWVLSLFFLSIWNLTPSSLSGLFGEKVYLNVNTSRNKYNTHSESDSTVGVGMEKRKYFFFWFFWFWNIFIWRDDVLLLIISCLMLLESMYNTIFFCTYGDGEPICYWLRCGILSMTWDGCMIVEAFRYRRDISEYVGFYCHNFFFVYFVVCLIDIYPHENIAIILKITI